MPCHRQPKPSGGFSLIELLVVIAIVAILLSFMAPALSNARKLARQVVCAGKISQVFHVLNVYQSQNRDLFPRLQDASYGVCTPDFDPGVDLDKTWVDLLCDQGYFASHIEKVGVPLELRCPSAIGYDNNPSWAGHMPHVGANSCLNPPASVEAIIGERSFRGRVLSYNGDTSSKIMLLDSAHLTNPRGWFGAGAMTWVGFRHGDNAANVLYLDGHAKRQAESQGVPVSDPRHPFNRANFSR